jgi:hypothetical protein
VDKHVLLVKEVTVLQSIAETVIEVRRCYGMEINIEKLWQ